MFGEATEDEIAGAYWLAEASNRDRVSTVGETTTITQRPAPDERKEYTYTTSNPNSNPHSRSAPAPAGGGWNTGQYTAE